jgi:hypothetical protein
VEAQHNPQVQAALAVLAAVVVKILMLVLLEHQVKVTLGVALAQVF